MTMRVRMNGVTGIGVNGNNKELNELTVCLAVRMG